MDSVLKATRSVLQALLLCSKCNDFKFVAVQLINVEVIQVCVWYMMEISTETISIITRVKLLSLTQTLN